MSKGATAKVVTALAAEDSSKDTPTDVIGALGDKGRFVEGECDQKI